MSTKKTQTPKKKRKNQAKVRWEVLENEYISTRISYKDLAAKHKITQRQVEKYGSEHNWVQKRRDFIGEVSENVKNTLINDETKKQLDYLAEIGEASKRIIEAVTEAVNDKDQFYKRSFYSVEKNEVVEYRTDKIDGAAVNQVLKALEKVTDIYCAAYGIEKEENKKRFEIDVVLPEGMKEYGE
ncbi:MAG: hypothetical protein IJ491_09820 [Clostridia bacterium]|nr:hypothetical protein [Clostridia bacterium]